MNKNAQTKQYMGKIVSFHPTGEYYFGKGIKAYDRHDYHGAAKYLLRAKQLEPGEPMILFQLAVIYTELGKYGESNELLHEILEEIDEDFVECYYLLANNYAYLGLFEDAHYFANLYLDNATNGEFKEDTEELLELLSLEFDEGFSEEDSLIMRQEQAKELLELGKFTEVIELLSDLIVEYPQFWPAYNNLALAYFYTGEADKAMEMIDHVLQENEGNLHALCNKLVLLYYEGKIEAAKQLIQMLKKVKPMLAEHQFKLGTTFALVGSYEHAYQLLRTLQKRGFQGDGSFYYWLSYAAYHIGKIEFAQSTWKKVLLLSPEKSGMEPWKELVEEEHES